MNTAMPYGGWFAERPTATGSTSPLVRLAGWMAVAGAAFAGIGTGGELLPEHLQQNAKSAQHANRAAEVAETKVSRTPSESLQRIREVLNPAVSDLAVTLNVSRQSIYNWLNGEPVAEENAAKLHDLAQAADVLAHEGIPISASLLKRKFANGRTLLQMAQAGESARDAALTLIKIHKRETAQRERMNARFATRAKTPASADFDLPASNDLS
ncbi:hypothetical protein [Pseudomonas aeruginosa]|uniref:hypothetical protein n=1 Tax=Pseudomonas aeruginosa TaxID=287 RepID=UPI001F4ABBEA|nr:hypothetical protein [Pseudomonas aeruginosa]